MEGDGEGRVRGSERQRPHEPAPMRRTSASLTALAASSKSAIIDLLRKIYYRFQPSPQSDKRVIAQLERRKRTQEGIVRIRFGFRAVGRSMSGRPIRRGDAAFALAWLLSNGNPRLSLRA